MSRAAASAENLALRALSVVTDDIPPHWRFGHWQRVLQRLAPAQPLPAVARRPSAVPVVHREAGPAAGPLPDLRCLLIAGALDNGGVESVVSILARGLPEHGVEVEVACSSGGRVARELAHAGVRVVETPPAALRDVIAERRPDVVQLHRVDRGLLASVAGAGVPVVPVFHAMESYLDRRTWHALRDFLKTSGPGVAVSGSVRGFFAERAGGDIRVVVNGVDPAALFPAVHDRRAARLELAQAIGVAIADDDVLVVALQRYSDQKNPAGLVDAFLLAAEGDPRLRLVVAGAPDNWLEYRRADQLRRGHPAGDRVHLLGDSDPATLLTAADAFALDSFAEGGPLSALEAAAFGVPVVLSDVGFARELLGEVGGRGALVPRANDGFTGAMISAERRRRHQSNRDEFAAAIGRAAHLDRGEPAVPERFSERAMVAAHARILKEAAAS
ncbi:MAG: glycosyltransferase [Microbacteriaceae bacterium]|nr:glycosyltransferase [Microbacteriaceae bacterium]MCL2793672.1 glycosyltransferase [Microbacteriaceae bacterium]